MRPDVIRSRLVLVSKSAKRLGNDRRRAVFRLLIQMPIESQRIIRLRVPQPARKTHEVITSSDQQARIDVPEAVETDIREHQLLARPPPQRRKPIRMQRQSVGLREHVISGSRTTETNTETGDILSAVMIAQYLERAEINRHKSLAVFGLRGFAAQTLLGFLETAFHANHGVVKIDVAPPQGAQLTAPQPLANARVTIGSKTWSARPDPLIGGRYHRDLGNDFALTAYGDVDGFGVGAHVDWQVLSTIDCAPNPWLNLHLGYRSLNFNYQASGRNLGFDVHMRGPIIACSFRF
jgi:hypothetical protein